ncbi:hypothetical protein WH47_03408, partial [Habropoda laboriosa]
EDHCPRSIKMEEPTPSKPSGQYGSSDRLERRGYSRAKTEFVRCSWNERRNERRKKITRRKREKGTKAEKKSRVFLQE